MKKLFVLGLVLLATGCSYYSAPPGPYYTPYSNCWNQTYYTYDQWGRPYQRTRLVCR